MIFNKSRTVSRNCLLLKMWPMDQSCLWTIYLLLCNEIKAKAESNHLETSMVIWQSKFCLLNLIKWNLYFVCFCFLFHFFPSNFLKYESIDLRIGGQGEVTGPLLQIVRKILRWDVLEFVNMFWDIVIWGNTRHFIGQRLGTLEILQCREQHCVMGTVRHYKWFLNILLGSTNCRCNCVEI